MKHIEAATNTNQEHLVAISWRTEQFSPSTPKAKAQHLPATGGVPQPSTHFLSHSSFPIPMPSASSAQFPLPQKYLIPTASAASTSQMSVIVPTEAPLQHSASAVSPVSQPTLPSLSSPGVPAQNSLTTASPSHMPATTCSPQFMCNQLSKSLTPYIVTCTDGKSVCVLPLIPQVPGQAQVRSSHDLILPPPEAFSAPNTSLSPAYPPFHTQNCTWNGVLSLVQQPLLLWPGYAPKNLSEYPDIMSLW
jgi:hypothetical protein